MAKITFIYPDFESLGVEYLMASCLKNGHEADYVFYHAEDMYAGEKDRVVNFLSVAKKIAGTNPHIAAFSCVTDNYRFQLGCAEALKTIMPDIITVFGGVHPTIVPEIVLKEKAVDCIAVGEAENSFQDFIKKCRIGKKITLPSRPVKGIVFKLKGNTAGDFKEGRLPDLNKLPFPYKKPLYTRLKAFSREYYIITARGCPYNCSYCFNSYLRHLRGAGIIRQRTVDNVIAELLQAKREYAPRHVTFLDDCFAIDDKWLKEFCRRYKNEVNLPFACIMIPQYLNKEKVQALSSAGCYHVQIGIQSLNNRLCNNILRRRSDNIKSGEAIRMLRDAGIMVQADHMLGIPRDTPAMEEDAALFYNKFRPNIISTFWLKYYPKTGIIDSAKQKGILNAQDIKAVNEGNALTKESLHTGGSMKDPSPYYGIYLLLNYLPLLPSWLVRFLIKQKLYKKLAIKNAFVSFVLPRFLLAALHRKDFRDRGYMYRYLNKNFLQKAR